VGFRLLARLDAFIPFFSANDPSRAHIPFSLDLIVSKEIQE